MTLSVNPLIAVFLSWCSLHRRPGTAALYKRHLDKWSAHVGDLPLSELTPWHLSSWGKTWHQVQAVQRLLQFAVDEMELLERSPFARVKRPPMQDRSLILSPKGLAGLVRAARPTYRRFLLAMRATLARPQEIRALCWEMLQTENAAEPIEQALAAGRAMFVMREYKGRSMRENPKAPRVILVNRRLGRLLLRLRRRLVNVVGHVFLTSKGVAWTNNAVRCCMRRLRKRCSAIIPSSKEKLVTYSIRHSMATLASTLGIRDRVLAEILGHTSTRTTARYQHLQVEHLRMAMKMLEKN